MRPKETMIRSRVEVMLPRGKNPRTNSRGLTMTAQVLLSHARAALVARVLLFAASLAVPAAAQQPGAMPPAPVGIVTTEPADLPITNELPGRIAPTRIAEVRPRVSGIVVDRVFTQGSSVKE